MANNKKAEVRLIDELTEAVRKKALGCETEEVNEEYAVIDGEMTLVKKKIKRVASPPDISAVKLMLEIGEVDADGMSEEQLLAEKTRLLGLLKECEYGTDD